MRVRNLVCFFPMEEPRYRVYYLGLLLLSSPGTGETVKLGKASAFISAVSALQNARGNDAHARSAAESRYQFSSISDDYGFSSEGDDAGR